MANSTTRSHNDDRSAPCIWMQAGVVRHRYCRLAYECALCRYDQTLKRTADENKMAAKLGRPPIGKRGRIVYWKDRLRDLPVAKRPCVHHMKQRIEFRACFNDYHCGNCEFDQYFSDQYTVYAVVTPVDLMQIKGIRVPQGYYLHAGHTWVKIEAKGTVRIGLDDFAQRVFGAPEKVTTPLLGKQVSQNQPAFRIGRGEKSAALLAPVSGVVTAVNPQPEPQGGQTPDPYRDTWLVRLHCENLREDLQNLMIGEETEAFVGREVDQLFELIEETAGPLAADGGTLGQDIYGHLPELGWERLSRTFLRTKE